MTPTPDARNNVPGWISLQQLVERSGGSPVDVAAALAVLKPTARYCRGRPMTVAWDFSSSTTGTRVSHRRTVVDPTRIMEFDQTVVVPHSEVIRVLLLGLYQWSGEFDAAAPGAQLHRGRVVSFVKAQTVGGGAARLKRPPLVETHDLILGLDNVFLPQEEVGRCRRRLELAPEQRLDHPVPGDVYDLLRERPGLIHLLTEAINPTSKRFAPALAQACAVWLDIVRPLMTPEGELPSTLNLVAKYVIQEQCRVAPYHPDRVVIKKGRAAALAMIVEPAGRRLGGAPKSSWFHNVAQLKKELSRLTASGRTL